MLMKIVKEIFQAALRFHGFFVYLQMLPFSDAKELFQDLEWQTQKKHFRAQIDHGHQEKQTPLCSLCSNCKAKVIQGNKVLGIDEYSSASSISRFFQKKLKLCFGFMISVTRFGKQKK